jgi:hypothetical protein
MKNLTLFQILNGNNYFSVNREIARVIGLNAAIILSEIIDKFCYFESKGLLNDGWFYLTVEDVEERTTLAKDAQAGAIRILKEKSLIETKQMGMPSKRHFRIFKEKFTEFCNSDNKKEETRQQDVGNSENKMSGIPTTAPYIEEPTQETKVVCYPPPVGSDVEPPLIKKIKKIHMNGHEIEADLDEVFRRSIFEKKDWTTKEIQEAWIILCKYQGKIREVFDYISGTVKNVRNKKRSEYLANQHGEKCKTNPQKNVTSNESKVNLSADASQGRVSLQSLLEQAGLA